MGKPKEKKRLLKFPPGFFSLLERFTPVDESKRSVGRAGGKARRKTTARDEGGRARHRLGHAAWEG